MVDLNLTKRQQEIFDFIKRYGSEHGYPPTVRDIGKAIGLTSSSTVHAHLANLEKIGLLRRDPTKPRALELLVDKAKEVVSPSPTGCRSSARWPPASRCSPRRTSRSTCRCRGIAGGEDGEFVLRVHGDSMKDAGILDGDHVIVRRQDTADDGEIVVALVGRRRPSSASSRRTTTCGCSRRTPAMEPIRSRDVQVLGRVVGLCRQVS